MYLMSASLKWHLISFLSQTPESLRIGFPLASRCTSPLASRSCSTTGSTPQRCASTTQVMPGR